MGTNWARPMGDDFPENPQHALQLQQACSELIRQLRAGSDARSETFLATFPACTQDIDSAIELIYTEFATREQLGLRPRAEEFLARFPDLADSLGRQLEIHVIAGAENMDSANFGRPALDPHPPPREAGNELLTAHRSIAGFQVLAEM